MVRDRPVASVSGERGWAWNRRQAERRPATDAAATEARADRRGLPDGRLRPRREVDRVDVRALERDLERSEQRLQSVITRYERLLTEQQRQLTDEPDAAPPPGRLRAALSAGLRWLTSR